MGATTIGLVFPPKAEKADVKASAETVKEEKPVTKRSTKK